jgi:hypothetical protein
MVSPRSMPIAAILVARIASSGVPEVMPVPRDLRHMRLGLRTGHTADVGLWALGFGLGVWVWRLGLMTREPRAESQEP